MNYTKWCWFIIVALYFFQDLRLIQLLQSKISAYQCFTVKYLEARLIVHEQL